MQFRSLPEDVTAELIETAQSVVGDNLRSITYFTEETVEQVYLRDYLEADADLEGFAESERPGFDTQMDYENTELGAFQFTIRVFKRGYLVRTIANGHGVFVTIDSVDREQFEKLGTRLQDVLRELSE